jgi:hypothetical protein
MLRAWSRPRSSYVNAFFAMGKQRVTGRGRRRTSVMPARRRCRRQRPDLHPSKLICVHLHQTLPLASAVWKEQQRRRTQIMSAGVESDSHRVMAALVRATHDLDGARLGKSWVAAPGPAMTRAAFVRGHVSVIPRTDINRRCAGDGERYPGEPGATVTCRPGPPASRRGRRCRRPGARAGSPHAWRRRRNAHAGRISPAPRSPKEPSRR